MRTVAAAPAVLATSRNVAVSSGNRPTSPSATAHLIPVVVAPAASCPSIQAVPCGHHIARSAMIGTALVNVTVADTAVWASAGDCSATKSVRRLLAGTA